MQPNSAFASKNGPVIRRAFAVAGFAAVLLCLQPRSEAQAPRWVGSWSTAACAQDEAEPRHDQAELKAETVRQIVHLSIGGLAVRVRFSNTFGSAPLVLRSVHVAKVVKGSSIDAAGDLAVTVGGKSEFSVPAGGFVWSDAAALSTEDTSDIAVSFFVPEKVTAPAIHYTALQTSYKASGDQSGSVELTGASKTTLRLILTGVDVASRTSPGAVVAMGSSTTDGAHSSMDKNKRWTDDLFLRLESADGASAPGVLNSGIAGNRVLYDGRGSWGAVFGEAGIKRFDRDVLAQSGVKYVIVYEGGNDIRMPGHGSVPIEETVSPEQMIGAFQIMAKKSHDRKLKFLAATIAPSQNGDGTPDDPGWEKTRAAFNAWVRTTKEIDGFVDFDAATRDPEHPTRLLPRYDSGDHLHPNDLGYQAMADAFDLTLFQ